MTYSKIPAPRFFNSHADAVSLLRSVYEWAKDQCVLDTEDGVLLSVHNGINGGLQLLVHEVWKGKFVIVKCQYNRHAEGDGWVQEVITPNCDPDRLGESVPSPFVGPTPIGKIGCDLIADSGCVDATQCMVEEFFIDRGSRITEEQDGCAEQTVFYNARAEQTVLHDGCGLSFNDLIERGYREDLDADQWAEQDRAASIAEDWRYR